MDLVQYLPTIRKAVIALVVGFVISQLQQHGLSPNMSLGDAVQNSISAIVSGGLVYIVPNKR